VCIDFNFYSITEDQKQPGVFLDFFFSHTYVQIIYIYYIQK